MNANGNSAASPESEAVTPAAVPPAPGRPAVAGGDGQVTLTWTSNGDGGSAITEWEYQRKEGSGDWGSWGRRLRDGERRRLPEQDLLDRHGPEQRHRPPVQVARGERGWRRRRVTRVRTR